MEYKLYNKRQKYAFLDSVTSESSRAVYLSTFAKFYVLEDACGDDICSLPVRSVIQFLNEDTGAIKTKQNQVAWIKTYIRWCVDNSIPFVNKELLDLELDIDDVSNTMRLNMFASPESLGRRLNACFSPLSDCASDIPVRVIFWLAFMGLNKYEAITLKSSNVDLRNRKCYTDSASYDIPECAMETFRACAELESLKVVRIPGKQVRGIGTVKRCESDRFIRGRSEVRNGRDLKSLLYYYENLSQKITSEQCYLKYSNVYKSGYFWRTYTHSGDNGNDKSSADMCRDLNKTSTNRINKEDLSMIREYGIRIFSGNIKGEYLEWRKIFYGF